jgi:hypothetical protein
MALTRSWVDLSKGGRFQPAFLYFNILGRLGRSKPIDAISIELQIYDDTVSSSGVMPSSVSG